MYCNRCGNQIPPDETFCPHCAAAEGNSETKGGGSKPQEGLPSHVPLPTPPLPKPPLPLSAKPPGSGGEAKGTSGWAIVSLILGILSFACLPILGAILALIFGAMGKHDIKKSGRKLGGSRLATAGMILGTINILIFVIFVAVLIPLAIINFGKTQTVTRTINAQGAQSVVADLDMRDGRLTVKGGADALFEGQFSYNLRSWEPQIAYQVNGVQGEITVKQGGRRWIPVVWFIHNDWDIALNDKIPFNLRARLHDADGRFYLDRISLLGLDINSDSGDIDAILSGDKPSLQHVVIDQGSGDVNLDLNGKYEAVVQLDVDSGSGDVSLDLRGEWQDALVANVATGSGNITLWLPVNVGVYVKVKTIEWADVNVNIAGKENTNAGGMKRQDDGVDGSVYVNNAYGTSPVTLRINVDTTSGDINLI
jgi:N-terminal domain of toast_rack, DUF2154/Domain of unknown function (DUF4190)/zinc-ribbon domain